MGAQIDPIDRERFASHNSNDADHDGGAERIPEYVGSERHTGIAGPFVDRKQQAEV